MAAVAPGIDRVLQATGIGVTPQAPGRAVVLAAVPTLFSDDGEIDSGANRALYKFIAGLVDGLFVAGTTGEFPALDDAERLSLFELALDEAGPARVIAHVGAPDARHSARLARAAVALGVTRVAAVTPYYLPARPGELIAHYRHIRDAAPDPELYAYIFPERTSLPVSAPLFAQIAEAAGLAGAKLSGSAAGELPGYVAASPGLRIFSGDDSNPAATMRAGGAGVISGRSGAYPEVYAALTAALNAGDPDADRQQRTLDRIVALGASIGRIKHALRLRGLGGTTARMTVDPPAADTAAAIATQVAALPALLSASGLSVRVALPAGSRRIWVRLGREPPVRVARPLCEVRRKRGAGPQSSAIVRVPSSRPGESGAPDSWPVRAGRRVWSGGSVRPARVGCRAPREHGR
jgi:4-hydroxy-tetrahydrodipicolinate synthase